MGLFSKPEYIEVEMDFIYDIYTQPEEVDNGIISIEAYGNILDTYKYVTSSYSLKDMSLYDNGGYEEMTELLKNTAGKKVRVRFKTKDGKIKDAKILIESLADAYNDERFLKLELLGWGVGDKSFSSQV
ncbi:MAG: hypothetical protein ACI4KH_05185 [Oscillospiraceae bacterium]